MAFIWFQCVWRPTRALNIHSLLTKSFLIVWRFSSPAWLLQLVTLMTVYFTDTVHVTSSLYRLRLKRRLWRWRHRDCSSVSIRALSFWSVCLRNHVLPTPLRFEEGAFTLGDINLIHKHYRDFLAYLYISAPRSTLKHAPKSGSHHRLKIWICKTI